LADPLALAKRLLDGVDAEQSDGTVSLELGSLDPTGLAASLPDDSSRIVFWLNVYNAVVRSRIRADPNAYRIRRRFFSTPAIMVAGHHLSLRTIEHGMLRRSAFLFGLGYLRNPFASDFERRMRVSRVDPRIHFALNCGARSCPPLRSWDRVNLDQDLEHATAAYLRSGSRRTGDGREVLVPRLLLWYRGDFGGARGILALLRRHGVIGPGDKPRLRFDTYDWTLDAGSAAPANPMMSVAGATEHADP